MYVDAELIIRVASIITALGVIGSVLFTAFKWYVKQKRIEKDVKEIKQEQFVLTKGILACLKGLQEQGCNGPVTESIGLIEQHLIEKAHDQ